MKKTSCALCIAGLLSLAGPAQAQPPGPTDADKAAVRQAAYDYAEGYLSGAADRMERAVHPAILKRGAATWPGFGPLVMPMNAETLIDATRSNTARPVPPEKRNISFDLLDIREHVASARIFTANFDDYLHLVKQDGRWRIANVLWQAPAATGATNAEADKAAVAQVVKECQEAVAAGDPERLARLIHPEAAVRVLSNGATTGKPFLGEANRDFLAAAVKAKQAPPLLAGTVGTIDTYDTIASAAVTSPPLVSYWHLVKQNDRWRVLNLLIWMPAPPPPPPPAPRTPPSTAVGQAMPGFSLPGLDGRPVALSGLKGKNVLLVFPRGKVAAPDGSQVHWCQLCHYQYAGLAELDNAAQIRKKYNLEIVFVLPYDPQTVTAWSGMFGEQMAQVDEWRDGNPRMRERLPKQVSWRPGAGPLPFPVLADADRAVSKRLGLFAEEWDRAKVDQNMPTVFLLDKAGVVRYLHASRTTFDRPKTEDLLQALAALR